MKLLTNEELEKMNIDEWHIKEYAFIMLGNKLVNIGKRKPGIERNIYYDDKTPRPNINYDFFEYYNMKNAFGNLSDDQFFKRNIYLYPCEGWYIYTNYREQYNEIDLITLSAESKKKILSAIEIIKKDYKKRLQTYYKKYANKIYTHGYWANR